MLVTLISFIIVIGVLTLVHEFGHFITARRSGIVVDEFALGMGPMLFNRTVGETRYQVNLFPIGGYVKIAGMDGEEEDRANGFNSKPLSRRMMVIIAGSVMNLFLAALVFIILGMVGGRPVGVLSVVDRVIAGLSCISRSRPISPPRTTAANKRMITDRSDSTNKSVPSQYGLDLHSCICQ
jgi:regulator of sigma E protease